MKRQEFLNIKSLEIPALRRMAAQLRSEIVNLRLDLERGTLKDVKAVSKKRKDLAQVLTVLRQKELLEQLEKNMKKQQGEKLEEAAKKR